MALDFDSAETRRLLDEAGRDDRGAFERLLARHVPFLRQVVDARLDPALRARVDPSDVVQETQMEAFRRLQDFLVRKPMSFRLWLRKMACERLVMLERQHQRARRRSVHREVPLSQRSSLHLAKQLVNHSPSPSGQFKRRELVRQVRETVEELADEDREILLMRSLELLSNQEAAHVLGIEPAAASQRYGRALLRLRKGLLRRGVEGEGSAG